MSYVRLACVTVMFGLTAAVGGCGNKADEGPKPADFVGTWQEDTGVVASARFAAPTNTSSDRLVLVLTDDKKFKAQIADAGGKVNASAGTTEGTWTLGKGRVIFSPSQDGLTAKYAKYKPVETYSLNIDTEGKTVLTVLTADERMVSLVRK